MTDPSHPPPKEPASQIGTPDKITVYRIISENLKQNTGPEAPPEVRFLKTVTGAFVVAGLLNPRESCAFFAFWHDGLLEPCVLGLHLVESP